MVRDASLLNDRLDLACPLGSRARSGGAAPRFRPHCSRAAGFRPTLHLGQPMPRLRPDPSLLFRQFPGREAEPLYRPMPVGRDFPHALSRAMRRGSLHWWLARVLAGQSATRRRLRCRGMHDALHVQGQNVDLWRRIRGQGRAVRAPHGRLRLRVHVRSRAALSEAWRELTRRIM